jgi:hypothetical protein
MPYGEIRVDTITFTNAGVDKSITVSGLFASTSGNLTVTGTISGTTFTGTTANFTSGNVTTFSGGTCTITSGIFASGTATNPSISFIADSNTGLYSPGADQVAISTSGTGRLFVNSSGNVGIGVSAPQANLQVLDSIKVSNSSQSQGNVILGDGGSTVFNVGIARWNGTTNAAGAGGIGYFSQGSSNVGGHYFYTGDAVAGSQTERLRINSSGNVGIGTSSPTELLTVGGTTTPTVSATPTAIRLDNTYTGSPATNQKLKFYLYNDGSEAYGVTVGDAADFQYWAGGSATGIHRWFTSNTERLRIDSAGNLIVKGGSGDTVSTSSYSLQFGNTTGTVYSQINTLLEGSGGPNGFGGVLRFYTKADNSSTQTERLRIDSSGRLLVGQTTTGLQAARSFSWQGSGEGTLYISHSISDGNGDPFVKFGYNAGQIGSIIQAGNTGIGVYSNDYLALGSNNTERARIDSSGRLLVGTSTSTAQSRLNVQGNSANNAGEAIVRLQHGSTTPVSGVTTGIIIFGDSSEGEGAYIYGARDGGTWSGSSKPTRLVFSTTADGASSPTTRFTLNRVGDSVFSNTSAVYPTTDNAATIGGSSNRWSAVWAANGTIQTSDQRAKTEITAAQLGSNFIKALRPVSYKWIDGGQIDSGRRDEDNNYIYESVPGTRTHWGFIAQEVKEAVDAAGVDFGGWVLTDKDDPDSQQALRYDQFIAPLTKALQEALVEIDVLKAKVAALEGV